MCFIYKCGRLPYLILKHFIFADKAAFSTLSHTFKIFAPASKQFAICEFKKFLFDRVFIFYFLEKKSTELTWIKKKV